IADYSINVGLDPFVLRDFPPTDLIAGIDDDVVEQDPLSASISLPERMNHVQVTVELSDGRNQLLSRQSLKPVGSRHSPEKLRGLRFYASDVAEMRTALGNIDGTKLSGPFVYVVEQDAMDLLQVREIVKIGRAQRLNSSHVKI